MRPPKFHRFFIEPVITIAVIIIDRWFNLLMSLFNECLFYALQRYVLPAVCYMVCMIQLRRDEISRWKNL